MLKKMFNAKLILGLILSFSFLFITQAKAACPTIVGSWSKTPTPGVPILIGSCGQYSPCQQKWQRIDTYKCVDPRYPTCDNAVCTFDDPTQKGSGSSEQKIVIYFTPCGKVDGQWVFGYSDPPTYGNCNSCKMAVTQIDHYTCQPPKCGGADCPAGGDIKTNQSYQACGATDGQWVLDSTGAWSSWGDCNSCQQARSRTDKYHCQKPQCGGKDCVAGGDTKIDYDYQNCGDVDGHWSDDYTEGDWQKVGDCVNGKQTWQKIDYKTCLGRQCNGKDCDPNDPKGQSRTTTITKNCDDCVPVNGGWSDWTYGPWTALGTCGQYVKCQQKYYQEGYRQCNKPKPSCGGKDCVGAPQTEADAFAPCGKMDGAWSAWVLASVIKGICDSSTNTRVDTYNYTRTCTSPTCGGKACVGQNKQTKKITIDCKTGKPVGGGPTGGGATGGSTNMSNNPNPPVLKSPVSTTKGVVRWIKVDKNESWLGKMLNWLGLQ